MKNVGINARRIASKATTASDLCHLAAEKLLEKLSWKKEEIKLLIFVSQTPDFITPGTAPILQHRLGLSQNCLAFDINLGCSGYVYGLSVIAGMLGRMPDAKGLLLVGDKSSQLVSKKDKSTALLFSDAGSATALEYDPTAAEMHFDLYSDGAGYDAIMVKAGGGRYPFSEAALSEKEISEGIRRSDAQLILKGLDIFNFTLKKVVPSMLAFFNKNNIDKAAVDYFLFHQANKLINDAITRKLGIEKTKAPQSLDLYGNSSSASIPVTWVAKLHDAIPKEATLFLSGFGVGLSWANALIKVNKPICLEMITYEDLV